MLFCLQLRVLVATILGKVLVDYGTFLGSDRTQTTHDAIITVAHLLTYLLTAVCANRVTLIGTIYALQPGRDNLLDTINIAARWHDGRQRIDFGYLLGGICRYRVGQDIGGGLFGRFIRTEADATLGDIDDSPPLSLRHLPPTLPT